MVTAEAAVLPGTGRIAPGAEKKPAVGFEPTTA